MFIRRKARSKITDIKMAVALESDLIISQEKFETHAQEETMTLNSTQNEVKCDGEHEKLNQKQTEPEKKKATKLKSGEKKNAKHEAMPMLSVRFNNGCHMINSDPGKRGFKCKLKKCGRQTTVFCETCKVHICFVPGKKGRNCFKEFHELHKN